MKGVDVGSIVELLNSLVKHLVVDDYVVQKIVKRKEKKRKVWQNRVVFVIRREIKESVNVMSYRGNVDFVTGGNVVR